MVIVGSEYANQSTIYVGKPRINITTKAQVYETGSAPYYSATLNFTLFAAAQLEFESPTRYSDASLIHCIGKHREFGGLLDQRTETQDGYKYKCVDYTKRLFGKASVSAKNKTIYSIIVGLLKNRALPTSGIKKTTIKHPKIVIKNQKVLDICHQLAGLEGLEFRVNQDGIPILRNEPNVDKGYIFYAEQAVTDYSLDYDANDIITGVKVYGKDDKLLYQYNNQTVIVRYGNIQDVINDSNITTAADAKVTGQNLFHEKGKVQFKAPITIPEIINITDGEWCVFVPPKGSGQKAKLYYTQSVEINLAERTTKIELLDGKPTPPSNWIYTPPNDTDSCTSSSNSSNGDCVTGKPSCGRDGLSYRNFDVCIANKCPGCGKEGVLVFRVTSNVPEGEFHCTNPDCGMDWCICGREKWYPPHTTNTITILSGPTPSNNSVGKRSISTVNTTCESVSGAPSLITPSQIRAWVDENIAYSYYENSKRTVAQVIQDKKGNCVDQSKLVVALCHAAGIEAELVYLNVSGGCGGYTGGHANVHVKWQGRTYVIDTTCHAYSTI